MDATGESVRQLNSLLRGEISAAETYKMAIDKVAESGSIVVSAGLMSLGMMMMPPVMVSLPFKLLLFVLVDGWGLIVRSLMGVAPVEELEDPIPLVHTSRLAHSKRRLPAAARRGRPVERGR